MFVDIANIHIYIHHVYIMYYIFLHMYDPSSRLMCYKHNMNIYKNNTFVNIM